MVKGLDALRRRFAKIPALVVEEVEKVLDVVGPQLVAEIKTLAPVDGGVLQESIGFSRASRSRGSQAVRILKSGTAYGRVGIVVFAGRGMGHDGENYAIFQEFGTKNMQANPYFFPVWRANRTRVKGTLSRAVTRAVKKSNE